VASILEDISAPRCFAIEQQLQDLGIPVFHDDQHGTAIVLLAAMLNAARVVGRELTDLRVVINGAGAAGTAIARCCAASGTIRTFASPYATSWSTIPKGQFIAIEETSRPKSRAF
jgi:malate dehydrogenase (oxaloacetate-decarboxylating)